MAQRRKTRQRDLVLAVIEARCDHPTADQVYLDARAIDPKISRGTVYRNLKVLKQQGKILHVRLPITDRYEARVDHHYHLVCTECDEVYDLPLPYRMSLDEEVEAATGFAIGRHRTVFEGLCPACQAAKVRDREQT